MMVSHHPPPYSDLGLPPLAATAPVYARAPRAASVNSGRSHTRRHSSRHARSHHGGSSHVAQNEFPFFSHTGDVEIIIGNESGRKEQRYLLHRLILSQCSGFFEAGTRAEWSGRMIENAGSSTGTAGGLARINETESVTAGSSSRASSQERRPSYEQGKRKWRYELDWRAAGEDDMPMLVQKDHTPGSMFGGDGPPAVRNKPPISNDSFFRSVAHFSTLNLTERNQPSVPAEPGDEVLKDYDNLFRTMYQYPPTLDTVNIATAYTECKALLHLADMYDALEIVGTRVDHHLLRFGARLFKQIAKYPPSYLKLGYLARSRTIFTEALIHVVGQWPLAAPQLRGQVNINVMELLEDKVDELRELEERVESKLWRLNLTTSRGERVTPSNDFLSWLAMSLFRQWLAENTTPAPTGILKDTTRPASGNAAQSTRSSSRGENHAVSQRVSQQPASQVQPVQNTTGRVYRLIGSSDPSKYLNHDQLKRFLKAPSTQLGTDFYTRDNLKRFERRIDEVKNLARDAVKPLMRNFLELDLRDFSPAGLGYLTCTRLEDRDIPWDE
ncbi:uncharacterized protein MYCFIDRAFT_203560 [Pseudocercospora fijiensis CIRAD86]|uniref:BTB domain-containing protein n=1 Tax=Pseudocercospora fijiensis (strain CIRAD86) TaxID=383855 RepID=M3B1H4_PSEFD|nr:uncharacterized protein MYCFIDRAFT_203560 [Pseudocercospora fijiensis CIRAD86]EME83247.1 hypothetical protein MYCFIDRAFT_203560 [Pseudocercospora fijiensis CIRAD86]